MLPSEIQPEYVSFAETDDHSIVLITSGNLRHERFAYRMKEAFGDRVVVWYRLTGANARKYAAATSGPKPKTPKQRLRSIVAAGRQYSRGNGVIALGTAILRSAWQLVDWRLYKKEVRRAEESILRADVERLKKTVQITPTNLHPRDVATPEFLEEIKAIDPFFFLSLGGALYPEPLLNAIRGCAINQHAGHSPDFKGTNTIEWALYHRALDKVSNTVHITTSGADAGPILRRSNPCLFPDDNAAAAFVRVCAVGTELMIEAVREIIATGGIRTFPQSPDEGQTYLGRQIPPGMLRSVRRDFRLGWLRDELNRRIRF